MLKRLLIAGLACLGLQSSQARAMTAPHEVANQRAILKNGQTAREIKEDHFGGFLNGIRHQFLRSRGHTPYEWGISGACAKNAEKKPDALSRN